MNEVCPDRFGGSKLVRQKRVGVVLVRSRDEQIAPWYKRSADDRRRNDQRREFRDERRIIAGANGVKVQERHDDAKRDPRLPRYLKSEEAHVRDFQQKERDRGSEKQAATDVRPSDTGRCNFAPATHHRRHVRGSHQSPEPLRTMLASGSHQRAIKPGESGCDGR